MANLTHVVRNRIQTRATWTQWGTGIGLLAGVALAAWVVAPVAAVLAIPAVMVARRTARVARSGADGEAATLAVLRQLPDDHVVFNQMKIPCPGSKTGWVEADFVIVSPTRVTVVEAKNHRGFIQAYGAQPRWSVQGLGGRTTTMANPCTQVRRHAALLGSWLRRQGASGVWVETAVYFAHPRAGFTHDTMPGDVALLAHGQLKGHLSTPLPHDKPQDVGRLVEALVALRAWVPGQALPINAPPAPTSSPPEKTRRRPAPVAPRVRDQADLSISRGRKLDLTVRLVQACATDPDAVPGLLAQGASPNGEGGRQPLPLLEAMCHHPQLVDTLLAAGANPSFKDGRGRTPLGYAISDYGLGRTPEDAHGMVRKLLGAQADPNVPSRGITDLLMYACWNHPTLVLPLLQSGANDSELQKLHERGQLDRFPESVHAWNTWKAQKQASALEQAIDPNRATAPLKVRRM